MITPTGIYIMLTRVLGVDEGGDHLFHPYNVCGCAMCECGHPELTSSCETQTETQLRPDPTPYCHLSQDALHDGTLELCSAHKVDSTGSVAAMPFNYILAAAHCI